MFMVELVIRKKLDECYISENYLKKYGTGID